MPRRPIAPLHEQSEVITVRLTRADYERIWEIARAEDRTLSVQTRHLLRRALAQHDATALGEATPRTSRAK